MSARVIVSVFAGTGRMNGLSSRVVERLLVLGAMRRSSPRACPIADADGKPIDLPEPIRSLVEDFDWPSDIARHGHARKTEFDLVFGADHAAVCGEGLGPRCMVSFGADLERGYLVAVDLDDGDLSDPVVYLLDPADLLLDLEDCEEGRLSRFLQRMAPQDPSTRGKVAQHKILAAELFGEPDDPWITLQLAVAQDLIDGEADDDMIDGLQVIFDRLEMQLLVALHGEQESWEPNDGESKSQRRERLLGWLVRDIRASMAATEGPWAEAVRRMRERSAAATSKGESNE